MERIFEKWYFFLYFSLFVVYMDFCELIVLGVYVDINIEKFVNMLGIFWVGVYGSKFFLYIYRCVYFKRGDFMINVRKGSL